MNMRKRLFELADLALQEDVLFERLEQLRVARKAQREAFQPFVAFLPDSGIVFQSGGSTFRVSKGWDGFVSVSVDTPPELADIDLTAMELATDSEPTDQEVEELKTELRHIYSPSVEDLVDAINPIDQEVS